MLATRRTTIALSILTLLSVLMLAFVIQRGLACRPIFSDEFNGAELDTGKWNTAYWWGRVNTSNHEGQYYAPDAFEVKDGILHIRADQRSIAGQQYTSGIITSMQTFSHAYGYFEIRAKVPKGRGFWPAFWLLPATKDWPPEIDVFEVHGHQTNKVYMYNHWKDTAGAPTQDGIAYVGPDFSQAFHTFAVDWQPSQIIWYIDGVERFRSNKGVSPVPMYLIANLAVGGDWPGFPDSATPFPSYLDIDYIRVYNQSCQAQAPATPHP